MKYHSKYEYSRWRSIAQPRVLENTILPLAGAERSRIELS